MTATRSAMPTSPRVIARWDRSIFDGPDVWKMIAVVSLLATAVGLTATDTTDLCSLIGPHLLGMTWLVMPIAAIASIVTVAALTRHTAERLIAATLAIGLTTGWTYAIVWASVGQAMQGTTC
jgi:hypothetical protein